MMRAKMQVQSVEKFSGGQEIVKMTAVCAKSYGSDGKDEDNTYAKFSPAGSLQLTIANPDLLGKIIPGTKFYIDFTPAE